jgi:WD40 repeat protein
VLLRDAATALPISAPFAETENISSAEFSPDGTLLATIGLDGVHMWETATQKPVKRILVDRDSVMSIRFAAGGGRLGTATLSSVQLWDVGAGAPISAPLRFNRYPSPFAISPDGIRLAASRSDNSVVLMKVPLQLPPPPEWFGEFSAVVGGFEFSSAGELRELGVEERIERRAGLGKPDGVGLAGWGQLYDVLHQN